MKRNMLKTARKPTKVVSKGGIIGITFALAVFADVINSINVIHITEDFLAKLAEFMHRPLTRIPS
ncbi:MAG: hypothetical protein CEE41_03105 [Hadesarchaea archaeon B3_Hades]|nr:MAG: hypothetical protein CEE41_03105 [Hadesarchaea archaeon B3_Hades]